MWCHSRVFLWPMFSRRDCSAESPLKPLWHLPSLETTYRGKLFFFPYFSSLSFDITLAPLSGNFIGTKERPRNTPTPTKRGHFQVWWWLYTHLSANATQSPMLLQRPSPVSGVVIWSLGKFKQIHEVKIVCSFFFFFFFVSLKHSPPPSPPQHVFPYILPSHLCRGFSGKCVSWKISR